MEYQAQTYLSSDKLRAFIDWADRETQNSEGSFKPCLKRAISLNLARCLSDEIALDWDVIFVSSASFIKSINCDITTLKLGYVLGLARTLIRDSSKALRNASLLAQDFNQIKIFPSSNLVNLIATLEVLKSAIPENSQNPEIRRAFARKILIAWRQSLHLDPEWLSLSEREVNALSDYFYINELMIRCKEAAVRVSFQTWSAIEDRILTVSHQPSNNHDLTQTTQSMKLFFSYAHKDERLRDELAKHLSLLKREGIITTWHDRDITAGTNWAQAIDTNLNDADIILLLISADFLASDYCYDIEMQRAIERHNTQEARVIPIILRPCDWHSAPFGKLQALPKDAKPVTKWDNPDEAFTHIAQGIRNAVAELQQRTNTQPKG
jgi:hypothetical protein